MVYYRFLLPRGQVAWGKLIPSSLKDNVSKTSPSSLAGGPVAGRTFVGDGLPLSQSDILSAKYFAAEWDHDTSDFSVDESPNKVFSPGEDASVLPPIEMERCPGVWAAGLNYRKHAAEVGMAEPKFPVMFTKGLNTVIGAFDSIVKPAVVSLDEMDYEAELAIVIGKKCKDVTPEQAMEYVLGITLANDVSSRKWQGKKGGGQWCRSKSYDTFLPLGPALANPNELRGQGQNLRIGSSLDRAGSNDGPQKMQDSNTKDMIFGIAQLISFVSQDTTLLPWTVLLTGTPEGVGLGQKPKPVFLQPGDISHVSLEGVGTMSNPIIDKSAKL